MSSADWSGGSAIDTNGNDYLTFNGGNNGTSIQATAEGTGLADQGVASQGIYALVVHGLHVREPHDREPVRAHLDVGHVGGSDDG